MTNNLPFEKAIIIGTSMIAFQCTRLLASYLEVEVIEYPDFKYSSLESYCLASCIPYSRLSDVELTVYLKKIKQKVLIISAFNTYIFPPEIVNKKNLTIVNYHNSLLPRYAGRNAEAWVIFMQEKQTGVTWHRINNIIDGGNILGQKVIILDQKVTSIQLIKKQHMLSFELFKELLPFIFDGVPGEKQKEDDLIYYKNAEIPGNGKIDLEWSMEKIFAFLRALDYGPLQLLGRPCIIIDGIKYVWKKYKIIDAKLYKEQKEISIQNDSIVISEKGKEIILQSVFVE